MSVSRNGGRVIESLHVRLSRGETRQNFNIWCTATTSSFEEAVCSAENPASRAITTFSCLYFDWGPDSARYLPHIDRRSPHVRDRMLEFLARGLPEALNSELTEK